MSASKQRGTRWEAAVVDYLIHRGWVHAERRALAGAKDKGDVAGLPGVCLELKNQNRITLAEWLDEATVETVNAKADVGAVWIKRRGHTSPAKGYVVMTGQQFTDLLKAAGW